MIPRPLTLVLACLSLLACGGLPEAEMAQATQGWFLPLQARSDLALVYVVRPGMGSNLFEFRVYFNDATADTAKVGATRPGEWVAFYAPAGICTLYSLAGNTATLTLRLRRNNIYFVEQLSSVGLAGALAAAEHQLRPLDEIEGRYRIKQSRKGTIQRLVFE